MNLQILIFATAEMRHAQDDPVAISLPDQTCHEPRTANGRALMVIASIVIWLES